MAYGSVLQKRRRALHARIVDAIERLYADRLTEYVDLLARHSFRGELWEKAARYFRQSGGKTAGRSAHREAVASFEHALAALANLPESREGAELAIDLRLDLRNSLYPLGEHEAYFEHLRQAEALATELNDPRRLGWVLAYLTTYLWHRGDHQRALEVGHRAVTIVPSAADLNLHVQATLRLGWVYHVLGDHPRAIELLRESLAPLTGDLVREFLGMPAIASVMVRTYIALSLAELGDFRGGLACGEEGLGIAESAEHPQSLVAAGTGLGGVCLRQGDLARAIHLLERAYALAEKATIKVWIPRASGYLGYAYALSGRFAEATPLLERAELERASGGGERQVLWLSWLGETCLLGGDTEKAAEYARRSLDLSRERRERGHEAGILRLHGEVASHSHPPDIESAQGHYLQAIALADELGMRPLLAHCHLGLGELYRKTKRPDQARANLTTAMDLYRSMDMSLWLPQAEGALADIP
ncbi:MAG: tetratricopeptide repeat protein [Thermoanaerobaculia bacterium]